MREHIGDKEYEPDMPPVQAGHILAYFFDIGPTLGENPISHVELRAWQFNIGIRLSAWEAASLQRLSREYMMQLQRAEKPNCPAPWTSGGDVAKRNVAKMMQDSIRSLTKT